MTAKVILNPYAGRWKAQESRQAVEVALQTAGISYDLVLTKAPQHGLDLAAQAVREGYSPIIAAGGDGSISEVINGIVAATENKAVRSPVPLGILPLGTANDLAVNLGLEQNLHKAARIIAAGKTRNIDLGRVAWRNMDSRTQQKRYFDNLSAIGLETNVTLIQQRITRLRGTLRYLVAALIGIMQNPQWSMRLEWENGDYQGPITLVSTGNNPLTGGLFYMTPHADPTDGLLTFVYGFMPTRISILRMLPRTMRPGPGSYVEHPDVHEANTPWLRIHSEQPTPVHADGEILTEATCEVEYSVLPDFLPVLIDD